MEIKETVFQIITGDEIISEGSLEGGKVWERYNESKENTELMPIEPPHIFTVEDIPYILIWWCVLSSLVYLIILLFYYIFYKLKKTQAPLKFAFKKSRLWWIVLLLIPLLVVVVVIIMSLIYDY